MGAWREREMLLAAQCFSGGETKIWEFYGLSLERPMRIRARVPAWLFEI